MGQNGLVKMRVDVREGFAVDEDGKLLRTYVLLQFDVGEFEFSPEQARQMAGWLVKAAEWAEERAKTGSTEP